MKIFLMFCSLLLLTSCMSTRIQFSDKWDPASKAVYEDYYDFYLLGFIGRGQVNVQKVCMDQKPYAIRYLKSAEDGIITWLTLGIYSPSTVRVWCGE